MRTGPTSYWPVYLRAISSSGIGGATVIGSRGFAIRMIGEVVWSAEPREEFASLRTDLLVVLSTQTEKLSPAL
ncbi:hypothetical protein EVJ58_g10112 [Rhodofomes roseus]|uniref:Uncharacterized protein n=1 Tax=Rhodofomes roseus TaxID=34475 RepID=A0A4Y9XSY3_9APHY|nr:hypothetical protein EVJ58_g10112 [Rhodofomes roseus]